MGLLFAYSLNSQTDVFNAETEPGSDGNKGVLRIPQGSSITGASPTDCLVLYPGHSLG